MLRLTLLIPTHNRSRELLRALESVARQELDPALWECVVVDNASTAPQRRVDWSVSIAYGDDVETARRTLLEILEADDRVLRDPAAVVRVASLNESAVSLTVRAWVRTDDYWDVFFDNNERFYRELPGKGLHFPFPQLDIHMPRK